MASLNWIDNQLKKEIDPAFALRADFIAQKTALIKPKKILDVGCGRGFYLKLLSVFPFVEKIVGVEINPNYADMAKSLVKNDKKAKVTVGSIYQLPFTDNYFDVVIASEILEHLTDEKTALKEIKRVLKSGGTLLLTVPNKNFPFLWDPLNYLLMKTGWHVPKNIWWLAGIWADHERLYTPKQISALLTKAGFKITTEKQFVSWCWPGSHFLLYGIGKNLIERLGIKSVDRFKFAPPSKGAILISQLMRLPQKLEPYFRSRRSMNIALEAKLIAKR